MAFGIYHRKPIVPGNAERSVVNVSKAAFILRIFDDQPDRVKLKVAGLFTILTAANIAAWVWAWISFEGRPLLLGMAFLAYLFGLRHAVDVDHITAIDNVVRKLSALNRKPIATGFFFSLGHSVVVILIAIAVTGATSLTKGMERAGEISGLLSTCLSGFFLFFIAFSNLFILQSVWKTFLQVRRGEKVEEEELNKLLSGRGFLSRILKSLFALVSQSRHMFLVGFLFGMGFDTATELGLFGLASHEVSKGLPLLSILVFPALFAAGMSLVDTADSVLMVQVYGWAFLKPVRKIWYNLTITALSIMTAFFIGGIEFLALLRDKLELSGWFWDFVKGFNDHWNLIGFVIVGLFILGWGASALWYRVRDYDRQAA